MAFNLRKPVADALDELLPNSWVIVASPVQLDGINKPTVQFWANDISRFPNAPNGFYQVEYTANLFTPGTTKVDDKLDEMLNLFLEALWSLDFLTFSTAQRAVVNDNTLNTWAVTFTAAIEIKES